MTERKKRSRLANVSALVFVVLVDAVIIGVLFQNFFSGSR